MYLTCKNKHRNRNFIKKCNSKENLFKTGMKQIKVITITNCFKNLRLRIQIQRCLLCQISCNF